MTRLEETLDTNRHWLLPYKNYSLLSDILLFLLLYSKCNILLLNVVIPTVKPTFVGSIPKKTGNKTNRGVELHQLTRNFTSWQGCLNTRYTMRDYAWSFNSILYTSFLHNKHSYSIFLFTVFFKFSSKLELPANAIIT